METWLNVAENTQVQEVHEDDDTLVAKIGQQEISSNDVLENMIVHLNWQIVEETLDHFLIEQEFTKRSITVSHEEISKELTAFRTKHELMTSADTHKWLEARHMSDGDVVQLCQYAVKVQKLKELLFANRLEEFFVYKKLQLQTVELYKIVVAKEEAAREIISSVQDGESFFDYARKYSLDQKTAKAGGYSGKIPLADLHPQVQDLVLKASPGALLGPIPSHKSFEIYLVDSKTEAKLEGELRQKLQDELFKTWISDVRSRSGLQLFV